MAEQETQPGKAVDSRGNPVIDPTKNVLDLVTAAIQRQDDLRKADAKLIESKLDGLRAETQARLESIAREFALIESRRVEQKTDTKVAVDAALSAAEKAVRENQSAFEKAIAKSEATASEQAKQQNATFTAILNGVTTTLADVKDRTVAMESSAQGAIETRTTQRSDVGMYVGVIGAIIGIGGFVAAMLQIA